MIVHEWMREVANRSIEAAPLQSELLYQMVIGDSLSNNDYEDHLSSLRRGYKNKKRIFVNVTKAFSRRR